MRAVLHGDTPVRHDFSGGALCVVHLRLSLRNCLPQTASVCVEAGVAAEGASAAGAFLRDMSRPPFAPGRPIGLLHCCGIQASV